MIKEDIKMTRVVLIVAYFGNFPPYARWFFKSIELNETIDFLIITDQDDLPAIGNVHYLKMSFDEFRKNVQSYFDFTITMSSPYKIVDYKPAFGYIFEDFIQSYDFWGNIDVDVIFGNLRHFLTEEVFQSYDKINELGHLTLYRNTKTNNRYFMSKVGMPFTEVFTTNIIRVFDERIGMQAKFDLLGVPSFLIPEFIDVDPFSFKLKGIGIKNYPHQVFLFRGGKVFQVYVENGNIHSNEFMYVHFQKRNVEPIPYTGGVTSSQINVVLTQNGFKYPDTITADFVIKNSSSSIIKEQTLRAKKAMYIWHRRFKKYILKK